MSAFGAKKMLLASAPPRGAGPISVIGATYHSATSAVTIPVPTHKRHDLIIIATSYNSATPPAPPAGWTVIRQFGGFSGSGDRGLTVAYRYAEGPGTESGTWPSSGNVGMTCIVLRGVKGIGNNEVLTNNSGSNTTKTIPAVTVTKPDSYVLATGLIFQNTFQSDPSEMVRVIPQGETTRGSFVITTGPVSAFASRTYTATSADSRLRTISIELLN